MNRPGKPRFVVLASLLLAGLLLGALWAIQSPGSPGAPATGTVNPTQAAYPVFNTPAPYTPPPLPTDESDASVITDEDLTPLWFTPEATLTATPSLESSVVSIAYDGIKRLSLTFPAGWYAYPPAYLGPPVTGLTYISNYDIPATDKRPDDGIYAELVVVQLGEGMTFDEWVEEQQHKVTMPDFGLAGEISEVSTRRVGKYDGVSFVVRDPHDLSSQPGLTIYLLATDADIIAINIVPADSPNAPTLLAILDTISLVESSDP